MLTIEERQKLVQIIAGTYDFANGDPRSRRVLLEQAGLHRFLAGIDFTGPPRVVAADVIGRVENFGDLPERPTYQALGALLSYLLSLGELPQDQASFLAILIVRYSLVLDPGYIEEQRTKYGITEMAINPPGFAQLTPPTTSVATEIPAFEVEMPDEPELERIIHTEDNFLDIYLLAGAIYSAQAVCRIEDLEAKALGTGLLIGPDLLLTNQHVLKNQNYLSEVRARFDYKIDASGVAQIGRVFKFQPNFYFASDASKLDYALVRLQDEPLKHIAISDQADNRSYLDLVLQGKHRGFLVLAERFIKELDRVNVIQHPDGRPVKVVLTQNYVIADMTDSRVQYVADTMAGSSGSPVFNQNWEVVALHHSGEPYPPDSAQDVLRKAWKGRFRVNEGIPIRAILKDFRTRGLERYLPRA